MDNYSLRYAAGRSVCARDDAAQQELHRRRLLTLALGIGATTAVFSVVYGVLLRPLPYPRAGGLMRLSEEHPGANSPLTAPMLSNLTFHAWSEANTTTEEIAAHSFRAFTVARPGGAVRMTAAAVTPSLFPLLGATPALGRFFRPEERADRVLVLSDRAWREWFNGDAAVVGTGVVVDGNPYEVIGVARPGFSFPDRDALVWTPLDVQRPSPDAVAGRRGTMTVLFALARLKPGVSVAQAEAEGTAAARRTVRPLAANLLFGAGGAPVVHVRHLQSEITSRVRPALLVLAGGVLCVLLIACVNVANLFLSRGVARQRELTVRAAIGASPGRLARQLLTESLVLSALGGALGLGLAWLLIAAMPAIAARDFPRLADIAIDGRTMAFTAFISLATTILAGVAPSLRGSRFNLVASLHGGDGASAGGFRGVRARRLRDGLLVAEASFAVMLLVAAALLARSFVRLIGVDAGYTAQRVLAAEIFVPGGDAPDKASAMDATVRAVLERARALPGVLAAGAGSMLPLDNISQLAAFPAPWRPAGSEPVTARALAYTVTPGYGEALGLRLRGGRFFTESDVLSDVRPWIVNEEFARLYLPPERPIGYQFTQTFTPPAKDRINEIVGIVGNVLKNGNDTRPQPEVYQVPHLPSRFLGRFEVAVRTTGNPAAIAPALRAGVREVAPTAAIETVTLAERFSDSVDQPRFAMTVLGTFAALALLLASIGLYGVLSYGVAQRRRELGVRAALGAERRDLVRLVVREGLSVTAIGLVLGLVGAAAVTQLMQGLLFGIAPLDAWSFAAAPMALVPVSVAASLFPAARAARTDPAEALRSE